MTSSPASHNGTRVWIKASPRGTRSGFAILEDGTEGSVTITVLPKPWATEAGRTRAYEHIPGSTTHVVMYETEVVAVGTSRASAGALMMGLTEISRTQADLLEIGTPPERESAAPHISNDQFDVLISLVLLAERARLTPGRVSFEGAFSPTLHRLIAYERLVRVVESLVFRARPRYAELTDTLEIPRGRLSERDLLFSMNTGTPRIESTFDELTMDTPLLQVVVSALHVVASERLPRKIAVLLPGLQTRAVHLLRHLSGVRLVPPEQAILIAERLWVGQLDRPWAPAVDVAVPVLKGRSIVPENGADRGASLLVHISTEKFWEQCLEQALSSAFSDLSISRDARPGEGVQVPAPWIPSMSGPQPAEPVTSAFPDFMFRTPSQHVVVADAKYKLGVRATPSAQDGYQLFAYSHLAKLHDRTSDFALMMSPVRSGEQPGQLRLERLYGRDYPLWLVRLPFPAPKDLQNPRNWSAYLARLTRTIREFSASWLAGETNFATDIHAAQQLAVDWVGPRELSTPSDVTRRLRPPL